MLSSLSFPVPAKRLGEWYKVGPFLWWSLPRSWTNISGTNQWHWGASAWLVRDEWSKACFDWWFVFLQTVDVPLLESVVNLTKDADDSEEEDEFGYTKSRNFNCVWIFFWLALGVTALCIRIAHHLLLEMFKIIDLFFNIILQVKNGHSWNSWLNFTDNSQCRNLFLVDFNTSFVS